MCDCSKSPNTPSPQTPDRFPLLLRTKIKREKKANLCMMIELVEAPHIHIYSRACNHKIDFLNFCSNMRKMIPTIRAILLNKTFFFNIRFRNGVGSCWFFVWLNTCEKEFTSTQLIK